MTDVDYSYGRFPLWLELSGLPSHVNEVGKAPYVWAVFHKIVELDLAINRVRPGIVETSLTEIGGRCGVDAKKVEKAVKALRKAAVLRAFIPDNEEETALLQVLTPIPTPKSADEVRAAHPDLFLECEWPPRYAVEVKEEQEAEVREGREAKVKRVVELYLNTFSMKINSLILDQLQMISDRYEMALIEKVFDRARKREIPSLSWILTEIRRELMVKKVAEQLRKGES
jgi:hypothetical protein